VTRKRLSTGDIRDLQRADVQRFNRNGVNLPNPNIGPTLDRHKPIHSDQKARAFGMEPVSPKRLFDLPAGDAGAGQSVYRRIHAFYGQGTTQAARTNYTKALAIATNRSSTQKARYFHVSVYGFGVRRRGNAVVPFAPLSISEAQDRQFEQIYLDDLAQTPITPRFVPAVLTAQARIMVHDESGQRFYDVDVIGSRSLSVYAWGVSVFLLVKDNGYEVDAQNPGGNEQILSDICVEDDVVGARVLPVFSNITDSQQNRTITITIDPADSFARRIIPIPPGSRRVQVFSNEPDPGSARWDVEFWTGRAALGTRPDLGFIDWQAGQAKTAVVEIPNASAIAIRPRALAPATGFSLVFEVEP
jgi:hypothetical protein